MLRQLGIRFFPVVLIAAGAAGLIHISDMRGPFWIAARQSPDYAYLLSSLKFLHTRALAPVAGHPGIPLTLFGAVVLGPMATLTEVLENPERYLSRELLALILFFVLSQAYLARALWRQFHSIRLSAALFVFLMACSTILERLTRFAPESLLLSLAALAAGVLIDPRRHRYRAELLGVLCALLLSTKVTAAGAVLFFLFSLEPPRRKHFLWTFVVASAVLWSVVVENSGSFALTLEGVARSTYTLRQFVVDCVREVPGMVFVIALATRAALKGPLGKRHLGVVLSLLATGVLLVVSPGLHYAVPLFAIAGVMLILALDRENMAVSFLAIGALIQVPSTYTWLNGLSKQRDTQIVTGEQAFRENSMTCNYGSSLPFALHKADHQTGGVFTGELSRRFPNTLFCDLGSEKAGDWQTTWKLRELAEQKPTLSVLGPPNEERRIETLTGSRVEVERKTPYESLYRLSR